MERDFKHLLSTPAYSFLRSNEHLGNSIIFLTLGGSHAYGTSTPTSDVDIRGCALNSKSDLLGLSNFEQVTEEQTDTVVYSFNKLIHLLSDCNPNTIELLGCRQEDYLYMTPVGKDLIANRKMFLSQKAIKAFGGYANQQLRRLQNALARDNYPQTEKEEHILGSIKSIMLDFENKYKAFEHGAFNLYVDKSENEDLETEIFMNVHLEHYPLRDYKNIWADMNNIVKDYAKLNKRNNKKDDIHLNKHAMHLIRLYLMCLDIFEKGEINTYRGNDIPLLMSIRNGCFQKADGTFKSEFFDLVSTYEKRLEYAKLHTILPEKPNYKQIEEFMMTVNRGVILNV